MMTNSKEILFSIVVPTYNRSLFITKLITGFQKQSYPHFELIIVDDGSTDNTGELVKQLQDSRVKYYWIENGERGAARNFGARHATGDYINYFDSDDLAYPNHLQTAHEAIIKLNWPMVLHLGFEIKDEKGKLVQRREIVNGLGNAKLLTKNYINPNPLFVHKSTLTEVEYNTDRRMAGTEDWLYHLKLAARYDVMAYDQVITSCMVQHAGRSMSIFSGETYLERNKLMQHYLKNDPQFMSKNGKSMYKITADMLGTAALNFVLEKKKGKAIQYLLLSIWQSPVLVFRRRTLAIFKYCLYF